MTSNSNLDPRLPALAMSGIALIRQLWILPRLKGFSMTISGSFLGIFCHQTLKVLTWAVVAVGGPALWRLAWASYCIDPSSALSVATYSRRSTQCALSHASVASSGLQPNSQDFGYSLGVLHHVPDTASAITSCADLLKPGAPLLLYLYYAFDNRPRWFRWLWHLSNAARLLLRRLPPVPNTL